MSDESSLPFADGDAPADAASADGGRLPLLLGAGAAVAAFGLGALLLLAGGGDEDALDEPVALPPSAAPADGTAIAAPVDPVTGEAPADPAAAVVDAEPVVPATFNDVVGRDPFKALVVDTTSAAGGAPTVDGAAAPTTDGSATDPAVDAGTVGADPAAAGGTTAEPLATGAAGSGTVAGRRVSLVDAYEKDGAEYAQTRVDGTIFTPAEGDMFADTFQLLVVDGDCASYLNGDEQFTLCEGQEVLK